MNAVATRHLLLKLALGLAGLGAVGCGASGSAFGFTFPDNQPGQLETLRARLAQVAVPDEEPVVAGIAGSADELFLADLRGGAIRWTQHVDSPVSAPHVAGDLVILPERRGVVARRVYDGSEAFVLNDRGLHLVGAGGYGDKVAIALSAGTTAIGVSSRVVYVEGGAVAWTRELDYAVGRPAVAGDMIFVPWATQNLSVLDVSGAEIARLRLLDAPLGHAFREGAEVFFGQTSLLRVGALEGAPESWPRATPALRDLPGSPALLRNTTEAPPGLESATYRLRLAFAPSASDEVSFADGLIYAVYYRLIFALSATDDRPVYVDDEPEDVAGVHAVPGGIFVLNAAGGLSFLDASGRRLGTSELPLTPVVATFRPAGYVPRADDAAEPGPLYDALLAAARLPDARLVPARTLAVHYLREIEQADVTQYLIDLCEQRRAPPGLRREACESLGLRRTGTDALLSSLRRHTRYLERTTAGPVGPLSTALAAQGVQAAVPLILDHLRDPATPEDEIAPLAAALGALGERAAIPPLRDFPRLYHAEARGPLAEGLVAVGAALLELEGIAAQPLLDELLDDPFTSGELQSGLAGVLADAQDRWNAGEASEGGAGAASGELPEDTAPASTGRSSHTTTAVFERALGDSREQLQQCVRLQEDTPSARVVLTLDGEGRLERVSVTPPALRACVERIIRRVRFPGNSRDARETVRYTIHR